MKEPATEPGEGRPNNHNNLTTTAGGRQPLSAPVPLTDWRRVFDAVPSARLMPWSMQDGATKRPLTLHGIKDATRDPDTLAGWAKRGAPPWPDALVGIVHISAGVIDVDLVDGGLPGIARARELAPGAPEGTSLSGGAHLWVGCAGKPELHCNRPAGKMGTPGLEWRGPEAGFIALTESDLEALAGELPAASAELIALVTGELPVTPTPEPPTEQTADRAATAEINRKLADFARAGPGGRYAALNEAAFTAGGFKGAGRLPTAKETELLATALKHATDNGALAKYGEDKIIETWRVGVKDGITKPLPKRADQKADSKPRERAIDRQWATEQRPVLNGVPLEQPINALAQMGVELRRNMRSMATEWRTVGSASLWDWEPVDDDRRAEWRRATAQRWIHPRQGDRPPKAAHIGTEVWIDAENAHCASHRIDPVLEWMRTLADEPGAPDLESALEHVWEVDERYAGAWARAVSRVLFIGIAYRTLHPGAKMDLVPILIGPQGTLKSSFFALLMPPERSDKWHVDDVSLNLDDARVWETVRGCVIAEMSEMHGVTRTDAGMLKSRLTTQAKTVRLPWGRSPVTLPVRHVWAGTSNDAHAIPTDPTGGRRWAPVMVLRERTDRDGLSAWLDRWRPALFAQALVRVAGGERPVLTPDETGVQAELTVQHMGADDRLDDLVARVADAIDTDGNVAGIKLREELGRITVGDTKEVNSYASRVAARLRADGYQSQTKRFDGARSTSTRWFSPLCRGVSAGVGGSASIDPVNGKTSNQVEVDLENVNDSNPPRQTPRHLPTPPDTTETERLPGFDDAMAELTCPRCGSARLPTASGMCAQCEALAR